MARPTGPAGGDDRVGGMHRPPLPGSVAVAAVAALVIVGLAVAGGQRGSGPDATAGSATSVATPADPTASVASADPGASPTPTTGLTFAPPIVPAPTGPDGYLLMPRDELIALPASGAAWDALVRVAEGRSDDADLCDQDTKHGVVALASALVFARTGDVGARERVARAIGEAIVTLDDGRCRDGTLALGRQLGSYALAADLVDLVGDDDTAFRAFLEDVRGRDVGGHDRWTTLINTHEDAVNNWGAFAGASRIAASRYLGDERDVARAATVLRGFLGDRAAYAGFRGQADGRPGELFEQEAVWACDDDPAAFVPVNGACEVAGVDVDGAIVGDIWRDEEGVRWPLGEGSAGISYTLESLQGLTVQAELLARAGYGDAWGWSDGALRRIAEVVERNADAGGQGWNQSSVSTHVPWLLNARLGTTYPTERAGYGRLFGYADWLYGD